jgi:Flp pilus assembly protein TadD
LKTGTDLTRQGMLREAIPHLLAARGGGADEYSSGLNLAICYLGTGKYEDAASTLEALRSQSDLPGQRGAKVNNLLAQAYLGKDESQLAWRAFERAAEATPTDETLYAFVADACTDHRDYELGLRVVDKGLERIPGSSRLHYERAVFLGRLDRLTEARPEFEKAAALSPGSYIAYLALAQENLCEDKYDEALRLLREGIKAGNRDPLMLSLLGSVLMRQGVAPGQAEFAEARAVLEEAASLRPDDSSTQIELGKLYLMEGHASEAVEHLEVGRRLEPDNPEVYAGLAHAYLRLGERDKARECQAQLLRLSGGKKAPASATPNQ